jgi:hypothetical protein
MSRFQNLISTSIVLTVIVGGVAGAAVAMALEGVVSNIPALAVAAGFFAVMIGTTVRHYTVLASIRGAGPGPGRLAIPGLVMVNATIAAIGGGLMAYFASLNVLNPPPSALIGCLAGVLASIALELLMLGYRARSP